LALLVLSALPVTSRADDKDQPYNGVFTLTITGENPQPSGAVKITGNLKGQATFLGPFQGTVEYFVNPDGTFTGTATKVATNGDRLYESLEGTLTATGSVGSFWLTGGTGHFKDARGGGVFLSTWTGTTTADVTFEGSASDRAAHGESPQPLRFHVSGNGVFNPANIGTKQGGDAGLVIGDGSGLAPYTASGEDFVLGDVDLGAIGFGANEHVGAAQSFTQGTLGSGVITWPVEVGPNPDLPMKRDDRVHITHTLFGDIYFTYVGEFILNLGTGVIVGEAPFVVTGGTGLFENTTGTVFVIVVSTGSNPSGGVDFHYEFEGSISLHE
jgi:hypothetical protein